MKLPLVQYECGCIGFAPNEGEIVIVQDSEGYIGLDDSRVISHEGKSFEPADPAVIERLADEMAKLLAWGNRFRDLRNALGIEEQR